MVIPGGYRIGKEEVAGMVFAPVYLVLGFLFEEPTVGIGAFALLAVSVMLARRGIEWPLAITIRTVHIIFIGLVVLMKVSPGKGP